MSFNLSSSLQLPGLSITNSLSFGNPSQAMCAGPERPQSCFPQPLPPQHRLPPPPPHHGPHHHHHHHHHGRPHFPPALGFAQNLGQGAECCCGGNMQAPRQGGFAFAMIGIAL